MKKVNQALLRNETVRARVTGVEHHIIQENARISGLSESEYIRKCLINAPIHAHAPKTMQVFCRIETLLNKEILCHDEANINDLREEMALLCRCLK